MVRDRTSNELQLSLPVKICDSLCFLCLLSLSLVQNFNSHSPKLVLLVSAGIVKAGRSGGFA